MNERPGPVRWKEKIGVRKQSEDEPDPRVGVGERGNEGVADDRVGRECTCEKQYSSSLHRRWLRPVSPHSLCSSDAGTIDIPLAVTGCASHQTEPVHRDTAL